MSNPGERKLPVNYQQIKAEKQHASVNYQVDSVICLHGLLIFHEYFNHFHS